MAIADRKSYQKMKLNELNTYDVERTLRENIYQLEQEDIRIQKLVESMVEEEIPIPIILDWIRQIEDNAGEIAYLNSILQLNVGTYDFTSNSVFKRGGK